MGFPTEKSTAAPLVIHMGARTATGMQSSRYTAAVRRRLVRPLENALLTPLDSNMSCGYQTDTVVQRSIRRRPSKLYRLARMPAMTGRGLDQFHL